MSADGETSGNDDGDDDSASSAEQSTEQVPAQQPSQPASAPSSLQTPEHHAIRIPHYPPQHQQSLHTGAESSVQVTASSAPLPVTNCCQEHILVESSSSDDRQPPCTLGVLMPEDPCPLPKSDLISIQQPPDK